LTRLTRSRSVGSRSNGCGGLRVRQAAGCVGSGSDGSGHPQAAGLDLVRWISIRRPRTRASAERRRAAVAGGEQRQSSPANSIAGSGARFEARRAPTRSARSSEATRGSESGGDAAERPDDAVVRHGNSGEVARAPRCKGSTTSGAGRLLTSLRRSWMAHSDETAAMAGLQLRRWKLRVSGSGARGLGG
jgi:hypothetical protein